MHRLLIINPGSTSTKIGVFEDEDVIFEETIRYSSEELRPYENIYDQYKFRKDTILKTLENNNIDIKSLDGVVGRGGLLKPVEGGTYIVNKRMLNDLKEGIQGEHASNLGGILAYELIREEGKPAFIVDPVVVDELEDVARISGIVEIERVSISHPLNQKAVARKYAKSLGVKYEDLNLIVAHLGGGISVGAHKRGRVVDVANALNGDGPFSPERAGSLPSGSLVELSYSRKYTLKEMNRLLTGKGGLVSYLDTNDAIEVVSRIDRGDKYAALIYYAMAYQVAKEIGAMSAVLVGKIDAILLTGGIAHDKLFINQITKMVEHIALVHIFPGEDELLALCEGGLRVLRGEEVAKVYK